MENMELKIMWDLNKEDNRQIHFVLQQVLAEQVAKSVTPTPTKDTSKMNM